MNSPSLLDHEWQALLALLPTDRQEAAQRLGAFTRKRQIQHADDLLRLLLVYAWGALSLRSTAAWARHQEVATLSDVALLERFQKAESWLAWLLSQTLRARCALPAVPTLPYRVRVVDATILCRPGSHGTDWRVHVGLDLSTLQSDQIELTDAQGGESFTRFAVSPCDLLVGDRGYAHRAGLVHVVQAGGHVLVRFAWQNLPLQHPNGTGFDLMGALQTLQGPLGEWSVQTAPDPKQPLPAVAGRVIALRRSPEAAEAAKRRARQNARKKGHTVDARTLLSCEFILVFTSVPADALDAGTLLALYRLRWQIECGFKRLKSILHLDDLPAHDPRLSRSWIYAKLLGALLVETLASSWAAFSPWAGPEGEADLPSDRLAVAVMADGMALLATGGRDRFIPERLARGGAAPEGLVSRPAA